jgi:hypothetical protein
VSDEEALAAVATVLERIATMALAGFKGDMNEADALSDINNLARDTIKSLTARTLS